MPTTQSPSQTRQRKALIEDEAHEEYQDDYQEKYSDEEYPMPHRYADAHSSANDREISLGTGTILALFLVLALVCSVFFGMGYTLGHKSTPPASLASSETSSHSLSDAFKSFKPAPGASVSSQTKAAATPETATPAAENMPPSTAPSSTAVVIPSTPPAKPAPAAKKPFDPDAEIVTNVPSKPAVTPHASPAAASTAAASADTSTGAPTAATLVQVAAVSHQEDADTLVAALKRKGYTVSIRHEPQDKLLHLQLGPYPSKKDAEAMRLRLQADGFNAILK